MKRFLFATTAALALSVPQVTSAQTATPTSSASAGWGFYVEGFLGLTLLDEELYDTDLVGGVVNIDLDPTNEIGPNAGIALGTSIPLSPLKLRLEGELSIRGNAIEEIENVDDDIDTVDDSAIAALSGMANAHADFYVTPNFALSAGAGAGYAKVTADITLDVNDQDVIFIDDESDTVFAYQLMAGVRYDITSSSTISLGYRYFATDDPKFEVAGSDGAADYDTKYATHNFNLGYAYNF